jgi:2-polyprenyl-3-methyl-5-hydroxy-6-metoxy-1,4-benzoquinol methylase
VGGFWGVFAITLRELGYDTTMTEALQYYSDSFSQLFNHIGDRGVTVVDYDPFNPGASRIGQFDFVTVMAVLEHYPHSLSIFIENVISIMRSTGRLYIEAPNIAHWPKRIDFLLGKTPLPPLEEIFKSKDPFIGHHHEFTISELRDLAKLSGLSVISERFYNYSPHGLPSLKRMLRNPIQFLASALLKDSRECLAILCTIEDQTK